MKKLLLGLVCAAGITSAQASSIAFGTDAIKLFDYGQFNISAQNALGLKSAVIVDATIDGTTDLGIAYKGYSTDMYRGVSYQLGGIVTNIGADSDADVGVVGKIGFEHTPAPHFVFYGNVTGTFIFGSNDIVYTPELGMMFTI